MSHNICWCMYISSRKVKNSFVDAWILLKTYVWENKYSNIVIIVTLTINCVVCRTECLNKVPIFCYKLYGRSSEMKINIGAINMFKSKHIKQ